MLFEFDEEAMVFSLSTVARSGKDGKKDRGGPPFKEEKVFDGSHFKINLDSVKIDNTK